MADKKGFELSLAYNEMLFSNGYRHNAYVNGPDATNFWAENFLYKHGLSYPISWHVDYEDGDGLHYKYDYSDAIKMNHEKFMNQVEKLNVSEFEKTRIIAIAEYFESIRLLLTKYINDEKLEEKGHVI